MEIICLDNIAYDLSQKTSFGFVLKIKNSTILLDCGPYSMQALHRQGIIPNDLDYVFISHMHPDHCLGLP